ncbi:hypothetical protein LRP88_03181 [Fusarium phalaenopsidis]|nr:hypothetical protein NCS56_00693000 [Fusarium sp. Ph1]
MAPDPKPPGRKRGRPPNASKPTTSASQDRPDEYEADVEEAARPKQRGRPKKSADAVEQSPPQEEAPKRKRGRPSLDSKDGDATVEAQPKRKRGRPSLEKQQDEEEVVEDAPKSKRGRRPKPTEEQQEEEQPDEDEVVENAEKPKRRRRAKPTEEEQNEEQQNEEEAVENAGKKKRGKRTKPTEEVQQQDEDEATEGAKKQKRKARSKATEDGQPEEEEQQSRKRGRKATQQQEPEPEAEPAPKKRRRREAPAEEEPEEEQTIRRSLRNSLRDLGPESVHNKGAEGTKSKKKKGRASDTREEEAENQQDEAQPKKRGRRKGSRPSTENAEAAKEQEQEQQGNANKRRRRTSKEAASSSDEELPSPPKPYPHIAPYTRTIKSSTIAAKWTPLTGASLPAASSILTLAHQPILQRTSSTRNRRTHASAALHLVSRRIERKLARGLPFPPASSSGGARTGRRRGADADGGRALELDFEAVLDGKTALERQLVPAKHAVELLRAEKARMEQELEDDYEKLRKLEADARAQTRERKDLYRKAHVLAPTSQPLPKDPDNTITTDDRDSSSSLKHLVDTPLEPLALQLAGHVESIRGNLQQADGVAPQLARTKAALQDVLHRYLDSGAYEQVLLG